MVRAACVVSLLASLVGCEAGLINGDFERVDESGCPEGWTVLTGLDAAEYGPADKPFRFDDVSPCIAGVGRGLRGKALMFPAADTWRAEVSHHNDGRVNGSVVDVSGGQRGKAAACQVVTLSPGTYRFSAYLRTADGDSWSGAFSLGVATDCTTRYAHDDSTGIAWTTHNLAMRGDPNGDWSKWGEWQRHMTKPFTLDQKTAVSVWIRFNYVNQHATQIKWEVDDAAIEKAPFAEQKTWQVPVAGEFNRVYDPSVDGKPWYINDHTIVPGPDGLWHLIGITHAEPFNPADEDFFAHAVTEDLNKTPWQRRDHVCPVNTDSGETHVWAPHIIRKDDTYYMFYCGGGTDEHDYQINVRTSKDLNDWQWHDGNPLFKDIGSARDPMIVLLDDGTYLMYYTTIQDRKSRYSSVAVRESKDLLHWSKPTMALVTSRKEDFGRLTESPFVFRCGDMYYLSATGIGGGYRGTRVWASSNPRCFDREHVVGSINSHAPEWLAASSPKDVAVDGSMIDRPAFVTHCGWKQGGVFLSAVRWETKPQIPMGTLTIKTSSDKVEIRRNEQDREPYRVLSGQGTKFCTLPAGRYHVRDANGQSIEVEIVEDQGRNVLFVR